MTPLPPLFFYNFLIQVLRTHAGLKDAFPLYEKSLFFRQKAKLIIPLNRTRFNSAIFLFATRHTPDPLVYTIYPDQPKSTLHRMPHQTMREQYTDARKREPHLQPLPSSPGSSFSFLPLKSIPPPVPQPLFESHTVISFFGPSSPSCPLALHFSLSCCCQTRLSPSRPRLSPDSGAEGGTRA